MGAVSLACSTLPFNRLPLPEAMRKIKAAGFDAADLAIFPQPGFGHLTPAGVRARLLETADEVTAALRAADVAAAALNAAFSDAADAPAQEGQALALLAHRIGARVVTVFAGRGTPSEAAERLGPALDAAQRARVTLAAEIHLNTVTENLAGTLGLLRLLPEVKLTLDPSHVIAGGGRLADWRPVFDKVAHVHLRDAKPGGWAGVQAPWGTGTLDLRALLDELDRADYTGTIAVEYLRGEDLGAPAGDPLAESVKARAALERLLGAAAS